MNRRHFLATAAAAPLAARSAVLGTPPRSKMGLATTCYMTYTRIRDPIAFMDHANSLGAGGVQMAIPNDAAAARNIRAHAEQLGLYVEAMAPMPKSSDTSPFENALKIAKEAGAVATRTGTRGGRRYEKWNSLNDWKAFFEESTAAVKKIAPIADRVKMPVGIENHKDWTVDELAALMKSHSSEYFGVLLDFGNNIALLDLPDSVMQLVPYTKMCHVKDMAVESYEQGFLLSEVPLGEGILDLRKIVDGVRRANPNARFSLEMITRDPLKVPCLTDKYWITFPDRNGLFLARTLSMVDRASAQLQPLPTYDALPKSAQMRMEDENVKQCLYYARQKLDL